MEATLDVWEIPPESAARVGHPAPFPVALPERLIHLHTYEGELVLDPFMGSGTTAVAAVRSGRHFVGYDTDPDYVQAALARLATETAEPQVDADTDEPIDGGWGTKELARRFIEDAGFTTVTDKAVVLPGVQPTFKAIAPDGATWWFEVVGGRTSNRPGLQRVELLWRAIAKGAIVHETMPQSRYVVLTTSLPSAAGGARALEAVSGPGKPVHAVIDLTEHPTGQNTNWLTA
jgi:site-specific DNA-methyltransferase (adenine-specific)